MCPFHMALADFGDVHSHSTELIKILSNVGAIAGFDTYKRYRETVIETRAKDDTNAEIPKGDFVPHNLGICATCRLHCAI